MKPSLSICISTSQRTGLLLECLSSIAIQDFDQDQLEILISLPKQELESVKKQCSHFPLNIVWLVLENSNSCSCKNLGLKYAKGSLLYFLDDDCSLPTPSHLKNLLIYHKKYPDVVAIGGRYIDAENVTAWGKAYNLVCNSWQDRHSNQYSNSLTDCFVGGNLSIKLTPNSRTIQFGSQFNFGGEESQYVRDLNAKNMNAILVNGLNVFHHAQHDMKTFFSRAWLHGQNKYHLNQEGMKKIFGDRRFLMQRRSKLSSKSLAALYIGTAQVSYLRESLKRSKPLE